MGGRPSGDRARDASVVDPHAFDAQTPQPSIRTRSWRLPVIGVATLLGLSLIVGAIYPALVETYKVAPSRSSL